METDLLERRLVRVGGSRGLWRGRRSCRGADILPPSAIVLDE
jgi:hypothetical protein